MSLTNLFRRRFIFRVLRVIFYRLSMRMINYDRRTSCRNIKTDAGPVIRNIQGSKMWLDPADEGIARDLIIYGIREYETTALVKSIVAPGDVIMDIGANIGYYALMESGLAGSAGKVYAVEPNPQSVEILKRNVQMNGLKNVKVFSLAIGDKDGAGKLNISRKSNWCSMSGEKSELFVDSVEVAVVSVDSFIKDRARPDFIRMDVEGFEYEIIKGMRKLMASDGRLGLLIEVHAAFLGVDKTRALLKALKENGFEAKKVIIKKIPEPFHVPRWLNNALNYLSNKIGERDYSDASIDCLINDELFLSDVKFFEAYFVKR